MSIYQWLHSIYAKKAEIRNRERTQTGEKPYQCLLCGATFTQRSNLQSHKRATHLQLKPYECADCGKSFKRQRLLDYHVKAAHTGERPYKCPTCDATFVYPEHFKKHRLIHTGEKPFRCEVCGKAFNCRDNRNAHRFVHSDKKPFECLRCGMGFKRKPLLYDHMKSEGHFIDTIVVNQPRLASDDDDSDDDLTTEAVDATGGELSTGAEVEMTVVVGSHVPEHETKEYLAELRDLVIIPQDIIVDPCYAEKTVVVEDADTKNQTAQETLEHHITDGQVCCADPSEVGDIHTDVGSVTDITTSSGNTSRHTIVVPTTPNLDTAASAYEQDAVSALSGAVQEALEHLITDGQVRCTDPSEVADIHTDVGSVTEITSSSGDTGRQTLVVPLTPNLGTAASVYEQDAVTALSGAAQEAMEHLITDGQVHCADPSKVADIQTDVGLVTEITTPSGDTNRHTLLVPAIPNLGTAASVYEQDAVTALSGAVQEALEHLITDGQVRCADPSEVADIHTDVGSLTEIRTSSGDTSRDTLGVPVTPNLDTAATTFEQDAIAALSGAVQEALEHLIIDGKVCCADSLEVADIHTDVGSVTENTMSSGDTSRHTFGVPVTPNLDTSAYEQDAVSALSEAVQEALEHLITDGQVCCADPSEVDDIHTDGSVTENTTSSGDTSRHTLGVPATLDLDTSAYEQDAVAALSAAVEEALEHLITDGQVRCADPSEMVDIDTDVGSVTENTTSSGDTSRHTLGVPTTLGLDTSAYEQDAVAALSAAVEEALEHFINDGQVLCTDPSEVDDIHIDVGSEPLGAGQTWFNILNASQ